MTKIPNEKKKIKEKNNITTDNIAENNLIEFFPCLLVRAGSAKSTKGINEGPLAFW
jgi:hypothetical protein